MKKLFIALCLLLSISAFAGFGGARSSGFSSGRSSFGGFRSTGSFSRPAPIYRPSTPSYRTTPSYSAPSVHTTVVHHRSGPGFFSGMMMGSMMNRPVFVAPVGGQVVGAAPVVVEHSGFYDFLMICLVVAGIGLFGYGIWVAVRYA